MRVVDYWIVWAENGFSRKGLVSWKIQLVLALNNNFMSLLGVCVLNLGVLVD